MSNTLLRRAEADDFDFYYDLKCEPDNIYWCGHSEKPEREMLRKWFNGALGRTDRDILIYVVGGARVGYAYVDKSDDSFETSVAVSKKFEGRGYGTGIVREALEYIKKNYEIEKVCAWVLEKNAASVRIHENAGYLKTGVTKTKPLGAGGDETMLEFRAAIDRRDTLHGRE
jgi:RimJ/RimL family protein N-acetyltransferase